MFGFDAEMMGCMFKVRLFPLSSRPLRLIESSKSDASLPFLSSRFLSAHARRDQARSRLPQDLLDLDGRWEDEGSPFPDGSEPRNEEPHLVHGGVQGQFECLSRSVSLPSFQSDSRPFLSRFHFAVWRIQDDVQETRLCDGRDGTLCLIDPSSLPRRVFRLLLFRSFLDRSSVSVLSFRLSFSWTLL